jgi:hypothetical protein
VLRLVAVVRERPAGSSRRRMVSWCWLGSTASVGVWRWTLEKAVEVWFKAMLSQVGWVCQGWCWRLGGRMGVAPCCEAT